MASCSQAVPTHVKINLLSFSLSIRSHKRTAARRRGVIGAGTGQRGGHGCAQSPLYHFSTEETVSVQAYIDQHMLESTRTLDIIYFSVLLRGDAAFSVRQAAKFPDRVSKLSVFFPQG